MEIDAKTLIAVQRQEMNQLQQRLMETTAYAQQLAQDNQRLAKEIQAHRDNGHVTVPEGDTEG